MIDEATRCGYSRCRAELPAPGPQGGRRRSFCRDTRWEGGRTCAQLARAERDALGALGLGAPGATFALDADRLRDHVDAVRAPVQALHEALTAVSARLDEVQRDAVAAVETANHRVAGADRARVAAEEAREAALRSARLSTESAERAAHERAEAVQRATAAARQVMEATEALGAARQQAAEAVAAKRAAEAMAGERVGAAEREVRHALLATERVAADREAERSRSREAVARAETLAAELTVVHRAVDVAEAARAMSAARADAAVADLDIERAARHALEQELADSRRRTQAAEADLDRDRAALAQAGDALRLATERAGVEAALRARAEADAQRLAEEVVAARPGADEMRALIDAALGRGPG